jgi:predicted RecB family endonuclease
VTGPRDPELIRKDIAETREELGEAVEALAAKVDVKARAREKFGEASTRMRQRPALIVAVAGLLVLAVIVARRR